MNFEYERLGENEEDRIRSVALSNPFINSTNGDEKTHDVRESNDSKIDSIPPKENNGINRNPNTTKVYPKHRKRIKRCSLSLYGNRPSYGIQTLHRDLWE